MILLDDKLISANALIDDLLNKSFYPVIVKRDIENAPALDVVEVVRCCNCVNDIKSNKCNHDSRLCSLNYYSDGGMKIVNWDDYCHLGRRK